MISAVITKAVTLVVGLSVAGFTSIPEMWRKFRVFHFTRVVSKYAFLWYT